MAAEERRLGDWLSSWAHKDGHAVCAPGLTSRLGLSPWPACTLTGGKCYTRPFCYAFVSFPLINSLCEVKSLHLHWQRLQAARPSGRNGVMADADGLTATAAAAVAAGRCWSCLSAHVLTASTVTYDQGEHSCPIHLRAWTDSQVIGRLGVVLEAVHSRLPPYSTV